MSLLEALQDWIDSRDIRKIRKRRREKAQSYISNIVKESCDIQEEEKEEDMSEQKVKSIKTGINLDGAFFVGNFTKRFKWSLAVIVALVGLALLLIILLLGSGIFSISSFEYEYKDSIFLQQASLELTLEEFSSKNIFLISTSDVEDRIKQSFSSISGVRVDKLYPSALKVNILEYEPAIILRKGQLETEEYLLSQAGYVMSVRPYTGIDAEYLVVQSSDSSIEVSIGDQLMLPSELDFIYRASNSFEDKVGIKIISIWWLSREKEVHMWTEKYFKVMMSLQRPVDDQIQDMIYALSDMRAYRNFEYIDLRIKNKVFIKPR